MHPDIGTKTKQNKKNEYTTPSNTFKAELERKGPEHQLQYLAQR